MRIQSNLAAFNTQRELKINDDKRSKKLEKLSSGLRINRASDDAAGIAISEKMRILIRGSQQGSRNSRDGVSLVQIADSGMQSIQDLLHRQRELAVQGATDTNSDSDKAAIQMEIDQLTEEITATAKATNFNGIPLLCVPAYQNGTPIAQLIVNEVRTPPVNSDGSFRFFATNDYGTVSQLLYGGASPGTSHPSILVNGTSYGIFNDTNTLTFQSSSSGNGVWTHNFSLTAGGVDLTISQSISIVENPGSLGGQSYKIDYTVTNNVPGTQVDFDFKYHVDTMLGTNDKAPFAVDYIPISESISFPRDANMPGTVQVYDNADNPLINGLVGINSSSGLYFSDGSEPDRLNIGQYGSVNIYGEIVAGANVGDSGYSLIWDDRTVGAEPVTMTTYYGVQNPPPGALLGFFDDLWIQSGACDGEGMNVKQYDCCAEALFVDDLSVMTNEDARNAIGRIDYALNTVSRYRSNAGAEYNRLEFKAAGADNLAENTTAAESRIRDADMAKEMTELAKSNILSQSATAMLSQANAGQQAVLQLLG